MHSGNVAQTYVDPTNPSNALFMNHCGGNNAKAVLGYIKKFPSPQRMLVAGCSAGAAGAGIHGVALAGHYAETCPAHTTVNALAGAFATLATDDFARPYTTNWRAAAPA